MVLIFSNYQSSPDLLLLKCIHITLLIRPLQNLIGQCTEQSSQSKTHLQFIDKQTSSMNKIRQHQFNLNTISIAYHRKPGTEQRALQKEPPQNHTENKRNDKQPTATIQYNSTLTPDKQDSTFNDANLKYGKSQTVKESYFNKLRIHIYRKEKKSKWIDLAASQNVKTDRQPSALEQQLLKVNRQNRTTIARRRLVDPSSNKIKTISSQNSRRCSSSDKNQRTDLNNEDQLGWGQKDMEKEMRYGRLDKLLNKNHQKQRILVQPKLCQRQVKHLSNNDDQIRKRLAKLEVRRFGLPWKAQQETQKEEKNQQEPEITKDFAFEAWDNIDIFSTNKNGIIEYANQLVYPNPEQTNKAKETNHTRKKNSVPRVPKH